VAGSDEGRAAERADMVAAQIEARGVRNPHVLRAMRLVPRELFVLPESAEHAYQDIALPIIEGQTISQPLMVAIMLDVLGAAPGGVALEVGAGSGYAAAVFSLIAEEVYTIERHPPLVDYARERIRLLGITNVQIKQGDGTLGWPEHAPYDYILVSAGGPSVPRPLREQLKVGGRLAIPVGPQGDQKLVRVTRLSLTDFHEESFGSVAFVPLIGEEGWKQPEDK